MLNPHDITIKRQCVNFRLGKDKERVMIPALTVRPDERVCLTAQNR